MPTLDPAPAPVARGREDVAPADDATAPAASAAGAATEAPAPDDDVPPRLARPARAEAAAPSQRLSPPQPVPRPAPRPTPIAQALATGEGEGDEAIDMANYGWTEFWSWARKRGYTDRKSLDAVVGRPTNGMTPLEIRKQIQAKQQG